jgi:hypothetical protein
MVNETRKISRRQALIGAGMVSGGALAAVLATPGVAAASEDQAFEGTWLVHVVPDDGSATHNVLYLVGARGTITAVTDNPPNSISTGFGVWERTSDDQFISTFEQFAFAPNGQAVGILRIRTAGSVDPTTGELNGRASVDFQPAGSPIFIPQAPTHFSATRIGAVAP